MCKRRSVHTCRRAGNWNDSPKSRVAAGGLAKGAMTRTAAPPVGGRTETNAAGAMNRTAGWGMAALGREPVGGVRNGGACYTGSVITCWRGQWPTRHRLWDRLGNTGGFWGSTQDFKHHWSMLLVPAKEMRTATSHALLPHPQGVFLGLLNCKPVHRLAVQHPVYEILNPPPSFSRMSYGVLAL